MHCATPDGRVLFDKLTFTIQQGQSMLIMGPSGSGKSSLLRIIAGLWPVDDGIVYRPLKIGRDGLFFVPQRPYITQGSLRTQILYPDTVEMQSCNDDTLKVQCDGHWRVLCRCCLSVIGLLWSCCCCDCVCDGRICCRVWAWSTCCCAVAVWTPLKSGQTP